MSLLRRQARKVLPVQTQEKMSESHVFEGMMSRGGSWALSGAKQ